jgi:hypothetical protein
METTLKEKLAQERIELNEKISKLEDFITTDKFHSIDSVQQSLLNIQYSSMKTYSQCLLERLEWLDKNE